MEAAIAIVATGKYKRFLPQVVNSISTHFLKRHTVILHIFTDEIQPLETGRVTAHYYTIPSYRFPQATLYRYSVFDKFKDSLINHDFIFYLDVDMRIEQEIGEEICGEITAVCHPGFFHSGGWGSHNVHKESRAYLEPEFWTQYVAGGFQGGEAVKFLEMSRILAENITDDENRGIIAEHNDETHFNAFINRDIKTLFPDWKVNELTPSYCMVENLHQRRLWKINNLPAKIVALDKNHAEVRS